MSNKITAVALVALMLLVVALPASAAVQVPSLEIRGTVVADVPATTGDKPFWDAQKFAGFYYDLKNNRQTESLKIERTLGSLNTSAPTRTIDKEQLWYNTSKLAVEFKVFEKEKKGVIETDPEFNTTYPIVGWRAEKWVAVKGVTNKLAKLVYEMPKEDKKTLTTGETWSLGSGYELIINAVDARASPRQVWFTLKKDGAVVDEGISSEGKVYYKTQTILGESDSLLFTVYVDRIFSGATSDMAQFRYAWLIDASSAIEVKTSDKFNVFEVRIADKNSINLSNENTVSLAKNTETVILGNINLKVADSNDLRFYPFVLHTAPGLYELRGNVVADVPATTGDKPFWDAQKFAGFYYDLKYNRQTESLKIERTLGSLNTSAPTRTIDKEQLWYNTSKLAVEFKVYEKENLGIITTDPEFNTTYPIVGWRAEKWVAVKGVTNKLAKLVYEMPKEDKKTLTTGETWSLGSGYEITINAVDARASPRQVWFTLKKDGAIVDEGISSEGKVYYKTQTILGESDALLFTVYVDRIFSGATSDMAQFRYAWLIDAGSAIEVKTSDKFNVFEVRIADKNSINLSNENTVSLAKNTETVIMGGIGIKVADSEDLRFYPKIDYEIVGEGGVTPGVTGTATAVATKTPNVTAAPNATAIVATATVTPAKTEVVATATAKPKTEPGFEIAFAIAGLLAVAYLVLRQRK